MIRKFIFIASVFTVSLQAMAMEVRHSSEEDSSDSSDNNADLCASDGGPEKGGSQTILDVSDFLGTLFKPVISLQNVPKNVAPYLNSDFAWAFVDGIPTVYLMAAERRGFPRNMFSNADHPVIKKMRDAQVPEQHIIGLLVSGEDDSRNGFYIGEANCKDLDDAPSYFYIEQGLSAIIIDQLVKSGALEGRPHFDLVICDELSLNIECIDPWRARQGTNMQPTDVSFELAPPNFLYVNQGSSIRFPGFTYEEARTKEGAARPYRIRIDLKNDPFIQRAAFRKKLSEIWPGCPDL